MAGFDDTNMRMGGMRNSQACWGKVTFDADSLTATVATQLSEVWFALGILTTASIGAGENVPIATFGTTVSNGNVTLTRQTADKSTTPTYYVLLVGV